MRKPSLSTFGFFTAAALVMSFGLTSPADAARTRLECRDQLTGQDASATARFERDGARRKFSVEVEAARGGTFRVGDVLRVRVDDVRVGRITLARGAVDLVGDLNFDTTAGPGDDADPFPSQFPAVGAGTVIEAGAFRCALQRR